jgi:hypothetical protein
MKRAFNLLIIITLSFSILNSCSKEEEENTISPLLGEYKLINYTSDIEIDLNNDSVKSLDLFNELNEIYFLNSLDFNSELKISEFKINSFLLVTSLPVANSNDTEVIESSYGGVGNLYELKISNDLLSVEEFTLLPNEINFPFNLFEINTENQTIILKTNQFFYCYTENEWVSIETKAVFSKN